MGIAVVSGALFTGLSVTSAGAIPPVVPSPPTSTPFTTPNTDNCPNRSSPAPAVDSSEVPLPGDPTPSAMAVPGIPVGGPRLGACGVVLPDDAPPLPADISASGWVVADIDSGAVLAAKDPHGRYRPASTIKMLLALVALDELDLDKTVTATAEDAEVEGSAVGIGKNGRYTNRQLMQGLVMASGNDAAHLLARQLGGDDAAVEKMNRLADSLGAHDTRSATPSGLDGPGMSSSPFDLALIFHAAMKNPTFAELISTETVQFPGFPRDPAIPEDKDRPPFALANDNQLLYNYPGALGGKTGFTDDARHTYVGGADRGGRRLVVTLLGAEAQPIRPWEQAARLLDYGFALDRDAEVGSLTDLAASEDSSGAVLAATPEQDSAATTSSAVASGSDRAGNTTGLRIGVGVGGTAIILVLLLWARRLLRRP
ncbi:D-alanyl-D-alanine carboxypeptidase [Rhodococcus sp. FXJ9.536]|uniref:D-alanyl-D-alanine carboxypeptidase n=1 Tax=Rhodococcus tibetensis TaxID=2965064 RepID=A0ABT1QDD5_9NOCA|nr:D-alanyl-D-alanine carboxypeptidase family protein [Rhodococcus sp. FXJ9.536]MCQ4120294.1 D-alanyl-D-alanine carboxypeptidase [Rhodococcus sp. FXJ9.536]